MFTLVWTPEAKAAYDELKAKAVASLDARRKKEKDEVVEGRRAVQASP